MTEKEWLTCTDPRPMLPFLKDKVSARKLRLFLCAECRRIWHCLKDQRSREAVEVAEKFADGEIAFNLLSSSKDEAWKAVRSLTDKAASAAQAVAWAAAGTTGNSVIVNG